MTSPSRRGAAHPAGLLKRMRQLPGVLRDAFWVVPSAFVLGGVLLALALVHLDRIDVLPDAFEAAWLYDGGSTGARTLLGAVASSTIGVAGTVFSITIAALSLAAGQMGPRLLRNFTSDRGNQVTLGIFLGTFSYTLTVLRSVRTHDEGSFVPHAALTASMVLALACVFTLVYFVHHIAARINVDTVIDLVSRDVSAALHRLAGTPAAAAATDHGSWRGARLVLDRRSGYLHTLDAEGLADWAARNGARLRLLVRAGDYVYPGAPIAAVIGNAPGVDETIADSTVLKPSAASPDDLEYAIRQLVEVGVRALSAGINDPQTAISVLERLGAALCEVALLTLPSGVLERDGKVVLVCPVTTYDGLVDTMFHGMRQNAGGDSTVLIRMMEVLTSVATCERDPRRLGAIRRHAALVLSDGQREIRNPADLADFHRRHDRFVLADRLGPAGLVAADT